MEEAAIVGMKIFDGVIACMLVWLAWRLSTLRDLFQAVVLFIVFGLIMAVAWVRLGALDVALAEAAIGAGLSGALFLLALGRMMREPGAKNGAELKGPPSTRDLPEKGNRTSFMGHVFLLGFVLVLTSTLGGVLFSIPLPAQSLRAKIFAEIGNSGIGHPVTAVLLNFRGYDTLLEIAVMLLGVVVLWSLGASRSPQGVLLDDPILGASARLMAPISIVVAGYLLWSGGDSPGGAFQAGAVMAMGGILLVLGEVRFRFVPMSSGLRSVLAAGLVVFLGTGISAMGMGGRFLEYPRDWAGTLIVLVELAAGVSIAAILLILFMGDKPDQETSPGDRVI